MKILHAHMALGSGGVEAMITSLSNEMSKGNDVEVLTIFEPKDSDIFIKRLTPEVKVYSLGKKKNGISFSYIWKMYRFIKNGKYDVVNIHGFFYYYILSVFLIHRKTKFFYTIHSDAVKENNNWDGKIFKLKQLCFKKRWMRPITISEASKLSFDNLYGCKSILIPNGVTRPNMSNYTPPELFNNIRITNRTKVFLHAGRISEPKNQAKMCEAFSQIIKDGYDAVLIIAGARHDEIIYKSLEPYFKEERIHYIGERNDITRLLYYSDAMLLPSIWEGLPVILLESLSVGCVPICSPVGGIVNVLKDGYNGILMEDASTESIIYALRKFLSLEETQISDLKRNAIKSFDKYDISGTANKYLKAYQSE